VNNASGIQGQKADGTLFDILKVESNNDVSLKDSTSTAFIQQDESTGNVKIIPKQNGDVISLDRLPRSFNGTLSYPNSNIQRGTFYFSGDDAASIWQNSVTFPVPFLNDNVVVVGSFIGKRLVSAGTPDDEGWFTSLDTIVFS